LSRIAKEGRKYSVFLGVIAGPADLDATILSQCSTVFAMRMARARPGDRQVSGTRRRLEPDRLPRLARHQRAIAFGEGVALPTRLVSPIWRRIPAMEPARGHARFEAADAVDEDFVDAIVDRWREASTTSARARPAASVPDTIDLDHGLGSLEAFATAPAKQQR
jgi:DNA helicase HerA-like ATPase